MRFVLLALMLVAFAPASGAGPLARQYGLGFEDLSWGDSIDDVVAKHPGGEHFYATGPGHRFYNVSDDKPVFGLPRAHMRDYFFLTTRTVWFPYRLSSPTRSDRSFSGR